MSDREYIPYLYVAWMDAADDDAATEWQEGPHLIVAEGADSARDAAVLELAEEYGVQLDVSRLEVRVVPFE
jgi:hypothetical protein